MAIPRELSEDAYASLDAPDKELYELKEGKYQLLFSSAPELLRAKEHEAEAAKKAKSELRALQQKIKQFENAEAERDAAATDKLKQTGDFKEYEEKLRAKHAKELAARDEAIHLRDTQILGKAVHDKAYKIAAEISTVPDLMADKIAQQIGAQYAEDGTIDLYVKDKDGKRGVDNFDALAETIKGDVKYSKVIIDTRATGGATPTSTSPNAQSGAFPASFGSGTSIGESKRDLASVEPKDLADRITKMIAQGNIGKS